MPCQQHGCWDRRNWNWSGRAAVALPAVNGSEKLAKRACQGKAGHAVRLNLAEGRWRGCEKVNNGMRGAR